MKVHVALLGLITACGGSDLDPGSGNDGGGGTQTLVVEGRASAEPRLTNARTATEFDTELSVRVSLNGIVVTTGSVTVTAAGGTFDLVFDPADNGRWRGSAPRYDEVYVLDVISGEDSVEGVRVDGPDIHSFIEPLAGATVDATQTLAVRWGGDHEAASASIDTEEIDALSISDTGDFELPPGSLKTEADKAKENTVRITRSNTIIPTGGAAGSEWAVTIRNEINVLAAPVP